jgi:Rnl2 family RNA ligase
MRFTKYTSIENAYREKFLEQVRNTVPGNEIWFVTEKIDGANFAFYSDGEDVKVASRNQFVDGTFYGCQEVIDRYSETARKISLDIMAAPCDYVIFFGELYGPGIQGKVNYGPEKDFALFDIVMVKGETIGFIKQDVFSTKSSFLIDGFKTAPSMGEMSLEEALKVPVDGKSLVFPEAEGENKMEGVVIKPGFARLTRGGSRIIIKNKNPEFAEREHAKKVKKEIVLSEEQQKALDFLDEFITQNRFDNLFGKQPWNMREFGRFIGEFNKDAIEDANKDSEVLMELEKKDRKTVTKMFNSRVAKFCRPFLEKAE